MRELILNPENKKHWELVKFVEFLNKDDLKKMFPPSKKDSNSASIAEPEHRAPKIPEGRAFIYIYRDLLLDAFPELRQVGRNLTNSQLMKAYQDIISQAKKFECNNDLYNAYKNISDKNSDEAKAMFNKALSYYNTAEKRGDAFGSMYLGFLYMQRNYYSTDKSTAYGYIISASKNFLAGINEKPISEENESYQKIASARYMRGLGILTEKTSAAMTRFVDTYAWYERAAKAGDKIAKEHVKRMDKALETSENQAETYFYQGFRYEKEKKFVEARENYKKAADLGSARAWTYLGILLFEGNGGKEDKPQAYECFKKASTGGHVRGRYCLAKLLERGEGVQQDVKEALRLFKLLMKDNYKDSKERYEKLKKAYPNVEAPEKTAPKENGKVVKKLTDQEREAYKKIQASPGFRFKK